MSRDHHHGHRTHALAAPPTLSLLRLSVTERLTGCGVVLGVLWAVVLVVMG